MVTSELSEEAQKFTIYLFLCVTKYKFFRQVWGGGINKDRMTVFMSGGSRIRNFRGRHKFWKLVHHHRVRGITTASSWVGLGVGFGNPSMGDMLSCRVPITLKKIGIHRLNLRQEGYLPPRNSMQRTGGGTRKVFPQEYCSNKSIHCV